MTAKKDHVPRALRDECTPVLHARMRIPSRVNGGAHGPPLPIFFSAQRLIHRTFNVDSTNNEAETGQTRLGDARTSCTATTHAVVSPRTLPGSNSSLRASDERPSDIPRRTSCLGVKVSLKQDRACAYSEAPPFNRRGAAHLFGCKTHLGPRLLQSTPPSPLNRIYTLLHYAGAAGAPGLPRRCVVCDRRHLTVGRRLVDSLGYYYSLGRDVLSILRCVSFPLSPAYLLPLTDGCPQCRAGSFAWRAVVEISQCQNSR